MIFNSLLKGNIVVEELRSELLEGNFLGDPALRRVPVYLPPDYHLRSRRYPAVYALSGLFGSSESWLGFRAFDENLIQLADRLIGEGTLQPFVMVFPECITSYGGSQYVDSPGTGRYMSHVCDELVPHMEQYYNLLSGRGSRAVAGKSSGGFGALRMAMARPDLFGHAAACAADMHFDMSCRPEIARFPFCLERAGGLEAFLKALPRLRKLDPDTANVLNIIALSSCYSPAPETELGFELPVDRASGLLKEVVFGRWLAQDPVRRIAGDWPGNMLAALGEGSTDEGGRMAAETANRESKALGSLDTLYLEAGTRDEYHADLGARAFVHNCRERGIDVIHEEFDGGHFGTTWRWEPMLKLLLEHMDREE